MIAIIGAGITGLASAYYLSRLGHRVTIFEKGHELGGLAAPFALDNGALLEKFYHHFFAGQNDLFQLLDELELSKDLEWRPTRMGFFCEGHIYPFSSPADVMKFKPLPVVDRLRFGFGGLLLSKMRMGGSMAEKPAIQWLRKVCGPRAVATIWEPLLKMKFGTAYDTVSLMWLQNRIKDRQRGRKATGREALGYLKGSIGRILDGLGDALREQDVEILTGRTVEEILVEGDRVIGLRVDGEKVHADAVLATTPNPIFEKLASMLPSQDLEPLKRIRYQGTICMTVKTRKPMTDFYWINVIDPAIPFVAAIEHTNFMDPDEYGGHLIYLGRYYEKDAPEWKMSDSELTENFLRGLERLTPRFKREDLLGVWTFRDPLTQPVFDKDYVQPKMTTALKNLFLANTSMLFPESRTINSSIRLAKEVNALIVPVVEEIRAGAFTTATRLKEVVT